MCKQIFSRNLTWQYLMHFILGMITHDILHIVTLYCTSHSIRYSYSFKLLNFQSKIASMVGALTCALCTHNWFAVNYMLV